MKNRARGDVICDVTSRLARSEFCTLFSIYVIVDFDSVYNLIEYQTANDVDIKIYI